MAWWEKLPRTVQAWLTILSVLFGLLGSAFAVGAMSSKSLEVTRELPGRMDSAETKMLEQDARLKLHDAEISVLHDMDARAQAKYDRLICLMLLPDELSAVESEQRCP